MRCFLIFLFLVIPLDAIGDEVVIIEAGARDLHFFLNAIPQGDEPLYGFSSRDDFTRASVGKPIPILSINENDDYSIFEANEWKLPVVLNNSTVTFLTVAKVNAHWQAVEIGGSGLADEVSRIRDVKAILRIYSLKSDFVMLNQDKFLPLESASIRFDKFIPSQQNYYTYSEIVDMVKKIKR